MNNNLYIYQSTKTYTHAQGLSCAFRQWRAKHSHCQYLHGYALQVKITFETPFLDHCNWVQDFGGLKKVKEMLETLFDHRTIVAEDDPHIAFFEQAEKLKLIQATVLPQVGCEAFAEEIMTRVQEILAGSYSRVYVRQVEVSEHPGNSAIVTRRDEPNDDL